MSNFEQKDMSGILFKNDRKESDKHPDYTGNARIDGRDYWMSAWLKDGKKGKFMSFAFKPKDDKPTREKPADIKPPMGNGPRRSQRDDMEDEIPF